MPTGIRGIMRQWSEDDLATLKTMWAAGYPARQIAGAIGKTRNAIIGKAGRLGLESRKKQKRRVDPHLVPKVAVARARRRVIATPVNRPADQQKNPPVGVSILDVGYGQCRAVIGTSNDPNRLAIMCGEPVFGGSSWCKKHLLLHHIAGRRA